MSVQTKPTIYYLEGNIGSGKSTLIEMIEKQGSLKNNVITLLEPVNEWIEIGILDAFYKDTKRWSFTFQCYDFITKISKLLNILKESKKKVNDSTNDNSNSSNNSSTSSNDTSNLNSADKIIIIERSIYTSRHCFAKNCYESGLMSEMEWTIYVKWFDEMTKLIKEHANEEYIFIDLEPSKCVQRIKHRNRTEEKEIPLEYLEKIHNMHTNWLKEEKVLYIDGTLEVDEKTKIILDYIKS
jgi:deoxyadenosine/deoxycytidine kinase